MCHPLEWIVMPLSIPTFLSLLRVAVQGVAGDQVDGRDCGTTPSFLTGPHNLCINTILTIKNVAC